MLHAAASSVLSFGVFRFLLGMGEAGNWPGGVKAVSEWFPAKERALATGFFNSGSTFGAIIAPPLVTWIALRWGWQPAPLAAQLPPQVWRLHQCRHRGLEAQVAQSGCQLKQLQLPQGQGAPQNIPPLPHCRCHCHSRCRYYCPCRHARRPRLHVRRWLLHDQLHRQPRPVQAMALQWGCQGGCPGCPTS